MTMTSVAEELWISRGTAMPTSTEMYLFQVAYSRMVFSFSPQALRRPVDMMVMPYRNRPTPPSRENSIGKVSFLIGTIRRTEAHC